ncbi:toll/interleukin-1 receptor domain-containing protein [Corallococcus exercitus]|uniref:Toll/interleukin-1 receptor domain-containing protein n=1 Tax=Corallococcus exercitus TaxID=2316736 RepID=A0A7Y4KIP8_9BACT|nr:toll/interleukin-1 receptor domain-containing protein [Corallococcus exercitus]NOK34035.1 toll/interleukin-1 receptor domain-containing protein [Corallococcus exercitus]
MLVFISHSTDPKAAGDKAYLDALVGVLKEPEFKVLLDSKSLEGSDDWPRELDAYMDECHAAVILFSRRALDSPWVNKEAAILSGRRAREPEFLLLCVALDGVSGEEVRKNNRFAAMELGRWEFVAPGTPAEVVARILNKCRERAPAPCKTPMDRLARKLTGMFERANLEELEDAAHGLGIEVSGLRGRRHEDLARRLANALAKARLEDLYPFVRALAPIIGGPETQKLIRYVRSLWVDAEAAGRILPIAERQGPRRVIGLNGRRLRQFTATCYLERAYREDPVYKLIHVDGALGQNAFEEVEAQIEKHFMDQEPDLEELDQYLRETPIRYFVLLPAPVPEPELLGRLQARFPRLTFALATGRDAHDDPGLKHLPELVLLEPPLHTERERKAWQLQIDLKVILRNVSEEHS